MHFIIKSQIGRKEARVVEDGGYVGEVGGEAYGVECVRCKVRHHLLWTGTDKLTTSESPQRE